MKKYLPLLILLSAAAVRFLTVAKLLPFTPDEEYLIYLAQTVIKNFHIIWIGVSSLGFDLYMGPFWIYVISPFLMISRGDPLILGYLASFLGVLTVFLLYWFGKKLFNERVGLIASSLYAFSPLVVFYDQKAYPSGVPLLALLMAMAIYLSKSSKKWWILFAVCYGLVFHLHLSLVLIILVALYWAFGQRKSLKARTILLSVLAFLVTVSPLIVFDYFHKASNITTPIRILQSAKGSKPRLEIAPRLTILSRALSRVLYLKPGRESTDEILFPCFKTDFSTTTQGHPIISGLVLILLISFAFRKDTWQDDKKRLVLFLSFSFLIPFAFLPIINPVEYYLLGFFPFLFLIIALMIESLKRPFKYFAYFLLAVFVILGIFTVFTAKGSYGLDAKKKLVTGVMRVIGENPYDLQEEGGCHKYGGWRYLFSVYGRKPERSSEDATFAWLFPDEVSNKPVKYSVLIKETRTPGSLDQKPKLILEEGDFTAQIFEH